MSRNVARGGSRGAAVGVCGCHPYSITGSVLLGQSACEEKDFAASRSCLAECLTECLTLCRALGSKRRTAYALEGCEALAGAQEQPERAARLLGAPEA